MCRWPILLLAFSVSASSWGLSFRNDWDRDFKSATDAFLPPGTDWRWLKAQCYQESRLNPMAVSPVGAAGLCQFMPGTWREVSGPLGLRPGDTWIPEASIRAAGYYMGRLHNTWRAERPQMDRHMLAMASYNAGAGHLITAQRLCGGGNLYAEIIQCLPQVTGRHSDETINYVRQIVTRWWPALLFE